ncbi:MAG: type II secretion system minor pseudopilin GspK [Deltaproteobacteria bacterium]|nr:type II secretion system minor pseudopilin GspK [Deltaproteobacteria bacterium]
MQRRKQEKGAALVVTLLIITTLVGLAVGFSDDAGVEMSLAAYSRDGYRAMAAASGAVQYAVGILASDENRAMDSLREDWGLLETEGLPKELFPDVTVRCRVVDENGKININALRTAAGEIDEKYRDCVERLFKILGMGEEQLNPVLDWLDADDHTRLDGAENLYYQGREPPYECANGPFLTTAQMYLVRNVQQGAGKINLADYFTVYTDGKININTASREVLQSLDDELDANLAEAIITYRAEEDFMSIQDLRAIPGMSGELFSRIASMLTVKSSAFSFEIEGVCGEASSRVRAVARRVGEGLNLVYWQVS